MEEKEFVVLDTSSIQGQSLINFMGCLGYQPEDHKSSRFVSHHPQRKANKWLSLETAQRLHNATSNDWVEVQTGWFVFGPVDLDILMNAYDLQQLYATRLVAKTKWQHLRKGGHRVVLQSPMVKPNSPLLTGLLGLA